MYSQSQHLKVAHQHELIGEADRVVVIKLHPRTASWHFVEVSTVASITLHSKRHFQALQYKLWIEVCFLFVYLII